MVFFLRCANSSVPEMGNPSVPESVYFGCARNGQFDLYRGIQKMDQLYPSRNELYTHFVGICLEGYTSHKLYL